MGIFVDTYKKLNTDTPIAFIYGIDKNTEEYINSFHDLLKHFDSLGYKKDIHYKTFENRIKTPFNVKIAGDVKNALAGSLLDVEDVVKQLYQNKVIDLGSDNQNRMIAETLYDTLLEYKQFYGLRTMDVIVNIVSKWLLLFISEATNGLEVCIYYGDLKKHDVFFLKWISRLGVKVLLVSPNKFKEENIIQDNLFMVVKGQAFAPVEFNKQKNVEQKKDGLIKNENGVKPIFCADLPSMKSTKVVLQNVVIDEIDLEKIIDEFKTDSKDRIGYASLPGAKFLPVMATINGYDGSKYIEEYLDVLFLLEEKIKMGDCYYERREQKLNAVMPSEVKEYIIKGESVKEIIGSLSFKISGSDEYNNHIHNAFVKTVGVYAKNNKQNPQRIKSFIHKLYVWLMREKNIIDIITNGKKSVKIMVFGEINKNDIYLYSLLTDIGVDLLIVSPNKEKSVRIDSINSNRLEFDMSATTYEFPQKRLVKRMDTVARQASQQIQDAIYNGETRVFKPFQLERHTVVSLPPRTTFEEIRILWKEEARFRPGFEVLNETVIVPNLFCKINGVMDSDDEYYKWLSTLKNIGNPLLYSEQISDEVAKDREFYKLAFLLEDGKINEKTMREHPGYTYDYLKLATQKMMIAKLQELIAFEHFSTPLDVDDKMMAIKIFQTLPQDILSAIEKFDFPLSIPKIIITNHKREGFTKEDILRIVYLSIIGFDIVILTGNKYRNIERYIDESHFDKHELSSSSNDIDVFKIFSTTEKKNLFSFFKSK